MRTSLSGPSLEFEIFFKNGRDVEKSSVGATIGGPVNGLGDAGWKLMCLIVEQCSFFFNPLRYWKKVLLYVDTRQILSK